MSDDIQKPKSNIHIHIGGAIIIIIIILILFKVNIKSFIDSPQFQGNINYIEQTGTNIWNKYLSKSVMSIWNNVIFGNTINQGINQVQSVISSNSLKNTSN